MLINPKIGVKYSYMKHEKYIKISYILAFCYIVIALFLADWAFHMVPYKNINKKSIINSKFNYTKLSITINYTKIIII